MKFRHYLLLILPLLSAACASLDRDSGPYKFREGWRSGVIEEVATAGALPKHEPDDCRYIEGSRYPASAAVVLVGYRSNRVTRHRVMPIPKGMTIKVGDTVWVNLNQCAEGLVRSGTK